MTQLNFSKDTIFLEYEKQKRKFGFFFTIQNLANFEVFCKAISSNINILFQKSELIWNEIIFAKTSYVIADKRFFFLDGLIADFLMIY